MQRFSIIPLLGVAAALTVVLTPASTASHSPGGGPHDFAVGGGRAGGGILPEVGVPVAFAAIETGTGDVAGHLSIPALNFEGEVICLAVSLDGSGAHFSAVDPDFKMFPDAPGRLDAVVTDHGEGPGTLPDQILIGNAPTGPCAPVTGAGGTIQGNIVVHQGGAL